MVTYKNICKTCDEEQISLTHKELLQINKEKTNNIMDMDLNVVHRKRN